MKQARHQHAKTTLLFIAIGLLAVMIGIFVQTGSNKSKAFPEFSKMIVFPSAKPIKHINFTSHQGQTFNQTQFNGKWSIVFFGFTNCPDICPTTMQTLKQVKQDLSEKSLWQNYQVVMVSVDPETDTPERLANYVPFFDSEFTGIVSNIEKTTEFAKQLGILFIKREKQERDFYEVDHSASLILINPKGQYAGVIGAPHKADEIAADLAKLAKHVGPISTVHSVSTQSAQSESQTQISEAATVKSSDLIIEKAWIRPAPPNAPALAAYFIIENKSSQTIRIVDSHSSAFDMTMIHNTVIEDGVAKMLHMDALEVPANSRVELAPLGTHMMLMRPEQALSVGDEISITLVDESDNEYQYTIPVRQQPSE